MSGAARLALGLLLLLLTTSLLAACGDLEDEGDGDNSRGELTEGTTTTEAEAKPDLPPLPSGQVLIDGGLEGSLTQDVTDDFRINAARTGLAIDVAATSRDEDEAFSSLCDGTIDLVDTSRRISEAELQACSDNGLQVVDFQIAFDATVIVTRNERDVGADCVNFDQLQAMFASGTPVSAWNQINPNFFPIQLTTTGPEEDASDFSFFGQRVLGIPSPTLADFRSDYLPFARENAIKNEIAGGKDEPGGAPPGTVGIIGFSFYELYEDKLRPLEIDGQSGDRCVFPSEETISSELYPLQRTLRVYSTQRSLNRQEVRSFLTFYLQRSEQLASDNELISISDLVRKQQLDRVEDPLAYGETAEGEVSEPDPSGTVSTTEDEEPTSTSVVPGTPSGSGVDTSTPEATGSAPPTSSTTETVPGDG